MPLAIIKEIIQAPDFLTQASTLKTITSFIMTATNPQWQHGKPSKIGILLFNLGTPEAPTPKAVRSYLAEFLSDKRVVEIPKAIWYMILYGIILNVRPKKSAAKYASIWTPEGSPLKVWTEKQTHLLEQTLQQKNLDVMVVYAMRYGNPSIEQQWQQLVNAGCNKILVLPLYPQYSAATTASGFDKIWQQQTLSRNPVELRTIKHYHDHPSYIDAAVQHLKKYLTNRPIEHLVLSFHGMPLRTLHLGDPYHCECLKTARLILEQLNWPREQASVTFQSRFGKAKWLEPYTSATVIKLAKQGTKHIAVFCPGFVSDCLETLEEINQELREDFIHAGGKQFDYIPCLNDNLDWIDCLSNLVIQHTQGWQVEKLSPEAKQAQAQMCQHSRTLALQAGAKA